MPRPVITHRSADLAGRLLAGIASLALLTAQTASAQPPGNRPAASPPAANQPAAGEAANPTPRGTAASGTAASGTAAPGTAASGTAASGTAASGTAPAAGGNAAPRAGAAAGGAAAPAAGPAQPADRAAPLADKEDLNDAGKKDEAKTKGVGTQLPPGFRPPAQTPEVMTIRKPLMLPEEITKLDNDLKKLRLGDSFGIERVLTAGDLNPQTQKAVKDWAHLQIAKMTAVDDWQKLGGILRDTMLKLRSAGSAQTNPNREQDFRRMVCEAMAKACEEVLPDNNFYVRMQAATILSQLNVREESPAGDRQPPVSYVPALRPLLDVIANPDQPEAVRVVAAKGVGRIAEYADTIDAELRYRAGDVLTKALADPNTHPWYQMRLAEALAAIRLDYDRNRQPIVLNALLQAVNDDTRPCVARTAAAKALGRIPQPGAAWNDRAVADALTKLAADLARNYNKDPYGVQWYECFNNLYLTAKPGPNEDVSRLPPSALLRKGTLTAPFDEFYTRVTPVVKHVLSQPVNGNHKPIPTELIQPLGQGAAAPAGGPADNRQAVRNP